MYIYGCILFCFVVVELSDFVDARTVFTIIPQGFFTWSRVVAPLGAEVTLKDVYRIYR